MRKLMIIVACAGFLDACAQKSAYEAAVEDYEPTYCYKSLAGVSCYKKPYFRDERRLVNYFGPAPERYGRPAPPPEQKLFAPKASNYWVKDPEPIPRAAPQGDLADRPWIGGANEVAVKPAAKPAPQSVAVPDSAPTVPVLAEAPARLPETAKDSRGLAAFLKQITENPEPRQTGI